MTTWDNNIEIRFALKQERIIASQVFRRIKYNIYNNEYQVKVSAQSMIKSR